MNGKPFNTEYMVGEEFEIPPPQFDTIKSMNPYERDAWGKEMLKSNGVRLSEKIVVNVMFEHGKLIKAKILNYWYKEDQYLG
jgi:hypothetical protein